MNLIKYRSWKIITIFSLLFLLTGCADNTLYPQANPKTTFQQVLDVPGSSYASNYSKYGNTHPKGYRSHQWAPPSDLDGSRRWDGIIIHHSATDYGDAFTFDVSHKRKGWDELGYHFVIDNGNNNNGNPDGLIEIGSRWLKQKHGAHCRVSQTDDNYWNEHYIGICLVGNFQTHPPTSAQYKALQKLVYFLKDRYNIPSSKIIGHSDADKGTVCPGKLFNWKTANL